MPQMAPMMWNFFSFLLFFILMMFIIKIYSIKALNTTPSNTPQQKKLQKIWKW